MSGQRTADAQTSKASLRTEDKRFAAGLCIACGKAPARPDRVNCAACSERASERNLARRGGRQGKKRCGECRQLGHDVRRCPRVQP